MMLGPHPSRQQTAVDRGIVALLSSVIFFACAFSAVKRPTIPAERLVSQDFSGETRKVFAAAKVAARSMGFDVPYGDQKSGLITTSTLVVSIEPNCDCGTWNNDPITGHSDLKLTIRIQEIDVDHSRVGVEATYNVKFTGRNRYGQVTREEFYRCRSLGRKEKEFFAKVNEYLGA